MGIPLSVPELITWMKSNLMLLALSGVIALLVAGFLKKQAYRLQLSHIIIGIVIFIVLVILLPIVLPTMF